MPKNTRATEDRISALQFELEVLQDELDTNQLEQEELRGLQRGLEERIEVIEQQLDEGCISSADEE
jgi:predicted metal-dependent phosphoesterase TrpH